MAKNSRPLPCDGVTAHLRACPNRTTATSRWCGECRYAPWDPPAPSLRGDGYPLTVTGHVPVFDSATVEIHQHALERASQRMRILPEDAAAAIRVLLSPFDGSIAALITREKAGVGNQARYYRSNGYVFVVGATNTEVVTVIPAPTNPADGPAPVGPRSTDVTARALEQAGELLGLARDEAEVAVRDLLVPHYGKLAAPTTTPNGPRRCYRTGELVVELEATNRRVVAVRHVPQTRGARMVGAMSRFLRR